MKKILFVLAFSLFSCSTEEKQNTLNGTFSEITPVADRTQITFKSNSSLTITKSGNSDNFNYKISDNTIILSNNDGYNEDFEFKKINENEIQIENLYPSIPENTKTYINFRK